MSIIISGSLAYDHIMNFPDSFKNHIMPDNIHILNVCFNVDQLDRSWGGTAGNIAYSLKLLGGAPLIVSTIGRDGAEYLKHFKKHQIKTSHITKDERQLTSSAYITTDADDNQITAFFGGPSAVSSGNSFSRIKEKISLAIISPTRKETMVRHAHECSDQGIKFMFDPGQQITAFNELELKDLITRAYFVVGNDYEIKLLEEKTGWDAEEILRYAKVLIVTLGEKGSVIKTADGEVIEVKSSPPESCDDPTGAGDAFRAGFLAGYDLGKDLKTCAQIGSVAASYAIETSGTQEHSFTKKEFCDRYFRCYNEKVNLK